MSDEKKTQQEYWQGFPEAPASDTFKWVDTNGFEHMTTLRQWTGSALMNVVEQAVEAIKIAGGKPITSKDVREMQPLTQAPTLPQPMITVTDETGVPVVDAVTGQPMQVPLPDGVKLYTVAGLFHDQTKNGKDVVKVLTVEPPYNKGYGVSCFRPNGANGAGLSNWKSWPVGKDNRYAPPAGFGHVLIREPQGESKYADVMEFRA